MNVPSTQDAILQRSRACLQGALTWYSSFRRHGRFLPGGELQGAVRGELQALKGALDKLDRKVIRIAAFGLVSRGKSAIVNALMGQKVLETGPIHGVTRYPKAVRWQPPGGKVEVELIDTPGLDEIEGEVRALMAQEVAQEADLILFVVSGDITRTEYEALCELRSNSKPLILVFNKIDLYPECDRITIHQQLQQLGIGNPRSDDLQELLSPEEIVLTAAEPAPLQVRVEWPDGKISYEWEELPAQIDDLRQKILQILNREGRVLLALNSLFQGKKALETLATKTVQIRQEEADDLIWNYAKYKALFVAINPIGLVDVFGGFFADLALIRALARLYGLPMNSYQAVKLWRKILLSSGGLFVGEMASNLALGVGKSASVISLWESPAALTAWGTTAIVQGAIAGYGSYWIGQAAKDYLEKGCTWGEGGASTVIKEILAGVQPNTILSRLRLELEQQLKGIV